MLDVRTSTSQVNGRFKRGLLYALAGASFSVFVLGSFVFAYLFLLSPTTRASLAESGYVPSIGGVSILPNPGGPQASPKPGASGEDPDKRRINFLLLGIDQRDDEKGVPTRSDTIMVVSVDQVNKTAAMISFARDLWVEIPGYDENRINVPNFLGDAYKYPGGGPALAARTIEQNFGIHIDYYARIDFRGFERIVDTLGGVDVNVENAIVDNEYPTEDYGTMRIYIPAGPQHMNGEVALQYARSRHSENDFGRARRQQKLMLAIRDRAMALDVIPKLPSLMNTLWNMVQTDIPPTEFPRLASLARDVDSEKVSTLVIDTKFATPFTGQGGADLLLPDKPAIRKAIGELFADPVIKEEAASIEVINGTAVTGLATRTGEYLSGQGFNVTKISSADRTDYKQTQIILNTDKKGTANLLASALKLSTQSIAPRGSVQPPASTPAASSASPSSTPDIRVILGSDFSLPQ